MVIFAVWLFFDCYWRLVHYFYTVGTVLVDLWRLVHQWSFCCVNCLLTVFDDWYSVPFVKNSQKTVKNSKNDDWYTNGHFAVLTVFWLFLTIGTVYHSSKTVKRQSKTSKMTIGVPIVTGLPRLYQQCNNSVPIVHQWSFFAVFDCLLTVFDEWYTVPIVKNSCCPRLNVRVHSSKVELAAAGVRPSGWHDIVTCQCQRLVYIYICSFITFL